MVILNTAIVKVRFAFDLDPACVQDYLFALYIFRLIRVLFSCSLFL